MSNELEFNSYKKVVIFGAKGTGKTSFIRSMKNMKFEEDSLSENGKY